MSGALYRKYRPTKFEDVVDQTHIINTLQNSIKNKSFAHAYLLTGPRGVGKTTVARIFAYSVNDVEYEEKNYSDIIEIDAASNRRIDEIRELREKINIAPSLLSYKVYIIDEVHMLTREAFNALLKTLEEPPAHAIFILATTDYHKVPDTIISRCVRFSFSLVSSETIQNHLSTIAKKEKIDIEPEALKIIADHSEGSFRDAISTLDQFRNSSEVIKSDYVSRILGLSSTQSVRRVIDSINSGSAKDILDALASIRQFGSNELILTKQLLKLLRESITGEEKLGLSERQALALSKKLLEVPGYANPSLALVLALIESSIENSPSPKPSVNERPKIRQQEDTVADDAPAVKTVVTNKVDKNVYDDPWQAVLANLKGANNTLYGIARMAEPEYEDTVLTLSFKFPFHYKQMNMEKNKMIITELIGQTDKNISSVKISLKSKDSAVAEVSKDPLKSISNIFGSAEVIES